jgi:hypothetical protein
MITIKTYTYAHGRNYYYLEIDGLQFGPVMFTLLEAQIARMQHVASA